MIIVYLYVRHPIFGNRLTLNLKINCFMEQVSTYAICVVAITVKSEHLKETRFGGFP